MKDNIFKGILILIGILAVLLLAGIFFRSKPPVQSGIKEFIEAKDETIKSIGRERDTYREWKDALNTEILIKDSLLKVNYKTTVIRYEKIPAAVNAMPADAIISAINNY